MVEISREQLTVVARAMGDVIQEVKGYERTLGVVDLRAHITELAKIGGKNAWGPR